MLGLEVPVPLEIALHVLEARGLALLDAAEEEGRGAVDPGAEGERGRHEVRRHAVHVVEAVLERAPEVLVELAEADMGLLAHLGWHHGRDLPERTTGEEAAGAPSPVSCAWGRGRVRPRGA